MWANSIDSQLDMKGGWVTKSYEASELGHSVYIKQNIKQDIKQDKKLDQAA